MEKITNHATDRRKYGYSEHDLDPDLMSKAGAYRVATKTSYAGNIRQQVGGYQTRRTIKIPAWKSLKMGQEAHKKAQIEEEKPKNNGRFPSRKARKAHYNKLRGGN